MIFKRNTNNRRLADLEVYVKQLEEFVDKFRSERDEFAKRLEVVEWRLKGLVKVYFPSRFRADLNLEGCLAILADELERVNEFISKFNKTSIIESRSESEGGVEKRSKVYSRLEILDVKSRGILSKVLLGYCTVNSLAKVLNVRRVEVKESLSRLVELGWLDVLKVKRLRGKEVFDAYFPSPYGLIACERVLNASWTFAQVNYLKELKEYRSDEDLIEAVKERLKHSHKKVITIKDDSKVCLMRFSGGSHKADLNVDGRFVECESLSNDLDQTIRMARALHEVQGEVVVVVCSVHALRMMLQRLCLSSWRLGYSLKIRIACLDELSHLEAMRKYLILRPPKPC